MKSTIQFRVQPLIVATLVILAVFSALNFQGHDYSYRWNMLALFVLLMLTTVHLITHYPQPLQLSRQYALISYGLFMLWSVISLFWSAVPSDSLLAWLTQLTGVFALYLGYQASSEQWRNFKWLLLPLALVVTSYTLYQSQVLHIGRPSGFLLNWNSNAAFIALLILPTCALFLQVPSKLQQHALGLVILYCAIAIGVTQSRGGLLVLLVGLLPLFWVQRSQAKAYWVIAQLVVYLLLGFAVAELLQGGGLGQRMVQSVSSGTAGGLSVEQLGSGRHALWAAGWQMYLDRPFLGWGTGMYHWLYPQYRNPLWLEAGQMAHNDYLEALLGLGPIGLLLLLLFVASVARLFWRAMRVKNLEYLALAGGALGILLHSFLTFNLSQSAIVIVLGLFVGYLSKALQDKVLVDGNPQCFAKPLYFVVVSVTGLVLSLWLGGLYMGFLQAELAGHEPHPGRRFAYIESAQKWLPYMAKYDALMAAAVIDLAMQEGSAGMTAEEHQKLMNYALTKVDSALLKNPLHSLNYKNKAEILEAWAQTPEQKQQVIEIYQQVLVHDPYDLVTRYRLTELLASLGQDVEAHRLLFAGLGKAYFTDLEFGMVYLLKVKQILEAGTITKVQGELLDKQLKQLATRMRHYKRGHFVLHGLGIES